MITTVNSTQTLLSVLKSAHAGDTILLEAGTYSSLSLTGLKFSGLVTIASKDPNDPAVLSGLSVNNSEGLKFSNLEVDLSSMKAGWGINLYGSKNIELSGLDVHGSLNNNPGDDQAGLLIRNSSDVRVLGSEFHEVGNGVNLVASNGVRLEGNAFHDVRSDGIQSSGASNIKIVGNTFTDFKPGVGDHPDAIQFFTAGNTTSAHDIEISDNLITRGEGATFQGIFVTDQVGNLPYQNVVITNNVVAGGLYNGIYVQSSDHLTLTGNTVAAYGDMQSWISVFDSSSAVVSGNEALKFSFRNTPDLVNTGNTAIPIVSDEGMQLIKAWIAENTGEESVQLPTSEQGSVDATLPPAPAPPAPTVPPPEPAPIILKVIGTDGADRLTVGGKADTHLEGGAGDDSLTGGGGQNTLIGGTGNDTYYINDANDVIKENADGGRDLVYARIDYTLGDNVENIKLLDGARSATGNALGNDLAGNNWNDKLYGLDGDDYMRGLGGNDTLEGGGGRDYLYGYEGDDRLDGGADADTLSGDAGADTIVGGAGNDVFLGGAGADQMTGGLGADTFGYRPTDAAAGNDRITDFTSAQGDRIQLTGIDANVLTAVDDKFAFIGKAAFSGKAGELRYDVAGGEATVSADVNGDRIVDFQIHLTGVSTLTSSDFML